MLWIYIAILGYFLNAVVYVIDKYLLSQSIPRPGAYAFWVAMLSGFVILLIPFGVSVPPLAGLLVAFTSGVSFFIGLVFLYHAVRLIDVTEAMPAVGAVTALATLGLSLWLLKTPLTALELAAFALLVGGTLAISYLHLKSRVAIHIIAAGFFLALSYVTLKIFFGTTGFVNGLFWTRLGLVFSALASLLIPAVRRDVKSTFHKASGGSKFLFVGNKVLAAAGAVLIYYAVNIGDVVFVNAVQGIQYVFIMIIGLFLYHAVPRLFERHTRNLVSTRKIIATILIVCGLALLFI